MPATIFPIVEGHGEVAAVPVLLRRIAQEMCSSSVNVLSPLRVNRTRLLKPDDETLDRALKLARAKLADAGAGQKSTALVLILIDGDDYCPKDLAADLRKRAGALASDLSVEVAVAKREFEAWFLAAAASLRGKRRVRHDAQAPKDPEEIRGAKERVERDLLVDGSRYSETTDQPRLAARISLEEASATRSFRHLVAVVARARAASES